MIPVRIMESAAKPNTPCRLPRRPWIKVCGITNPEDARVAIRAGADALGFNFWEKSKRFVRSSEAADWMLGLAGQIDRVGVFVNAEPRFVEELLGGGIIDTAQFHGDEGAEYEAPFAAAGAHFIKALPVRDRAALDGVGDHGTGIVLLDACVPGEYGGTGVQLDWNLARELVRSHRGFDIVLSGGLGPDNVAEGIRQVGPAGVDVASGVELGENPRRKDPAKVKAFVERAREAFREIA